MSTVRQIVLETCKVLWDVLAPEEFPKPTMNSWLETATRFDVKWNFPNCVGAIDGKHVMINCPSNSGSLYYNYKYQFSIVLMAVVNADYKFSMVDIGDYGSNPDGSIFASSSLGKKICEDDLDLPEDRPLPYDCAKAPIPFVFVGDAAFPARTNLMRPYPGGRSKILPADQRIFNYRLSRARRIVENAFGMMSQRFRIFFRRINLNPENAQIIVQATTVLHNFLTVPDNDVMQREMAQLSNEMVRGTTQAVSTCREPALENLQGIGCRASGSAKHVRDYFKTYFSNAGSVPWQNQAAHIQTFVTIEQN